MLKLVKLKNVVKCGKYSPAKFANFGLICITRGKMHHIWVESAHAFSSCGDGFCSSCRDQNLVHSWTHPLSRLSSAKCCKYVQNAAARVVVGAQKYEHITPIIPRPHIKTENTLV
jgi:hypothetical protein